MIEELIPLTFSIDLPSEFNQEQFMKQHNDAKWLTIPELLEDDKVHKYTKADFDSVIVTFE